jgi:hypothetical protein
MFETHSFATRRRGIDRLIEAGLLLLLAGMLLATIPMMASVPSPASVEPRPLPAPGPLAAIDFPAHARVDAACVAVLTRSSAVDNGRAPRAATITTALLEDACVGA